jgi:Zn-finger nucleic acid-binding protein
MSNLACPRCSAQLVPLTIEGQETLACPADHGVWIAQERLDAIAEDDVDEHSQASEDRAWQASDHDPDALFTEKFRACPVCANTLRKDIWKYGSGVVIDTCDEHGAWVDTGEIDRMDAWSEAYHRRAGR